ncbi:MAG: hypothetical protein U0X40_07430 [Ferruginibacter sp.]
MKKFLLKFIKRFLLILGLLAGLLLLYILFNLNLFHRTRPPGREQLKSYLLHTDSLDPLHFVADKFETHDIVFIGEIHKRKQDLDFLKALIPFLYKEKGIKIIGWEFGAAAYQREADSIVTASTLDRKKAIALMRNSNCFWAYEDYLDIFRVIWDCNRAIAQDSNKIRFLQLNGVYVPRRFDSPDPAIRLAERTTASFDVMAPGIVEKEVIALHKKILIYCGIHHALTHFKTPKFLFLKDNDLRAGQHLYTQYPDKIFDIDLLAPFPPRWTAFRALTHQQEGSYVFPFDAVFNQLYDSIRHPFAVNSRDPVLGRLKDYNSFYAFDRITGVPLSEFCDGIIMLAPFDQIKAVDSIPDWVTSSGELEAVKHVLPIEDTGKIKTRSDLFSYINSAQNLEAIRQFHRIRKFW